MTKSILDGFPVVSIVNGNTKEDGFTCNKEPNFNAKEFCKREASRLRQEADKLETLGSALANAPQEAADAFLHLYLTWNKK